MQKCTIPLELGAWRGPYHAHCPSRWCRRSQRRHRPFDRKGVSDRVDELCELWDKPGQNPSTPLGYSSTTAWSPISANRGRGRGSVPVPGQIGDGDGGASPSPAKSGTDAPSPSPDKSGTGTGTGTGVSAPCREPPFPDSVGNGNRGPDWPQIGKSGIPLCVSTAAAILG